MNNRLLQAMKKPPLYKKTEANFWDDAHISAQMLKAHLDPDFDGASRTAAFMDDSVQWICKTVSPRDYPQLLDLGCGPGLYAQRLADRGYQVTGVDFSRRSIAYAQDTAARLGQSSTFYFQDYLDLQLEQSFDFCTMIYCDYGALSTEDRHIVLETIHRHLKPGGRCLLDVFSREKMNRFEEKQTWEAFENGGFWRKEGYYQINGNYRYADNVTLEHITILTGTDVTPYYLWNTYFTKEQLMEEAAATGFRTCGVYGDVKGAPYSEASPTIAILLQK